MSFASLWGNWHVGTSISEKKVEETRAAETKNVEKKETVLHDVEASNTDQPIVETQKEVKKTVKRTKKTDNTEL